MQTPRCNAMLEYLIIFARGGAILWTFGQLLNVKGDPIESLIHKCLLEDRAGDTSYVYRPPSGTPYTLRWTLHNVRWPPLWTSVLVPATLPWANSLAARRAKSSPGAY
jgi:Signal recognition particle, alpha subunit, N-terminal